MRNRRSPNVGLAPRPWHPQGLNGPNTAKRVRAIRERAWDAPQEHADDAHDVYREPGDEAGIPSTNVHARGMTRRVRGRLGDGEANSSEEDALEAATRSKR